MPKIDLTYLAGLSNRRLEAALTLVTNGDPATIARDADLAGAIRAELAKREQAAVAAYVSEGLGE